MLPSNPNSVHAHNRRMVDQAELNAAYRERTLHEQAFVRTPVARDVKCVIDVIGPLVCGGRLVSATDRDGRSLTLNLKAEDEALAVRLREIMDAGMSAEIIYEESATPARYRLIDGVILTVC